MHVSVKTVSVMPLSGLGESGSATRSVVSCPFLLEEVTSATEKITHQLMK